MPDRPIDDSIPGPIEPSASEYFTDPVEQKVGFGKLYGERSFNHHLVLVPSEPQTDLAETYPLSKGSTTYKLRT